MINVKEFLINKKNPIFYIFQIIFIVFLFDEYFSYFLIFNFSLVAFMSAYSKNKIFEAYLILFVMLGAFIYSITSLAYKNPNYYFKNRDIVEGIYVVEKTKNKTRQMGSLTGRDSWIEPSSYESLTVRSEESNNEILIECSITELGCPFSDKINQKLYVKYVESGFFSKKYAFYIRGGSEVFNEAYFKEKYKKENYIKIFFIVFYLGGIFLYAYISVRERKFF